MHVSKAGATWTGDLKQGEGTMSVDSGAFGDLPFSYATRFGDREGTTPEEMIGAAIAGCFSMDLTSKLGDAGFTPEEVSTDAEVALEDGTILEIHLTVRARVPGVDDEQFQEIASEASEDCPVSRALGAVEEITLDATLSD